MADRLSTLDAAYAVGDLSLYPLAIDDEDSLYQARDNAITTLKQTLAQNSSTMIVADATAFPPSGLIRLGPPPGTSGTQELVYYGSRAAGYFSGLSRGFAGSTAAIWPSGTYVINSVMAEAHNAVKDALYQIENNLGVSGFGTDPTTGLTLVPTSTSLNGILKSLEAEFLSPKPIFRAFPLTGPPPLQVRFQNYSGGAAVRFLWNFGDGTTSTDTDVIHTYSNEGIYTVQLNIITDMGGQGIVVKTNYITVSAEAAVPFFYAESTSGISIATSIATIGSSPTNFIFVDQTDGPITERIWNFGDGTIITVDDPDVQTSSHEFQSPGSYQVTLQVILQNLSILRADLPEPILVS